MTYTNTPNMSPTEKMNYYRKAMGIDKPVEPTISVVDNSNKPMYATEIFGRQVYPDSIKKGYVKPQFFDNVTKVLGHQMATGDATPINFCFTGDAGNGKSYSIVNIARYLTGKDPVMIRPLHELSDAAGYSLANKYYVSQLLSAIRTPYTVVWLNEVFAGDPEVFTLLNAIFEEGYIDVADYPSDTVDRVLFPKSLRVEKHPTCVLIADDNTTGGGSTDLYTRSVVDQSFINRFNMIPVEYEVDIAEALFGKILANAGHFWNNACRSTGHLEGLRSYRDLRSLQHFAKLGIPLETSLVWAWGKNLAPDHAVEILEVFDEGLSGFKKILLDYYKKRC